MTDSTGERRPLISVPTNNPDDPAYVVSPGTGLDGVVGFGSNGEISCTGALLYTGRHILTAAHCFNFDDNKPNLNPNPGEYTVFFDLPQGRVPVAVSRIFVNPDWKADSNSNNDIAVIELAQTAPDAADRYEVYTAGDEVGKVIQRVGYGTKGTGNQGEVENDPNPIKRVGFNRYDALTDRFNTTPRGFKINPGTQLAYDFDNGLEFNDAFRWEIGVPDVGLGQQEVGSSSGDSGGPSFIDGKIAGVVSYGFSSIIFGVDVTNEGTVIDPKNDTSFGEFFSDTRVAPYGGFISNAIAQTNSGDDRINGTARNDLLTGNGGNDTIEGRDGDDRLFGNQGSDRIVGANGNDLLLGGRDGDTITGGSGNDTLSGNLGNDGLNGDDGDDLLLGGQDEDILTGGGGNDRLSGDFGRDVLIGGVGRDRFVLRKATSVTDINQVDIIADFSLADDAIELTEGQNASNVTLTTATLGGFSGTLIQFAAPPPANAQDPVPPPFLLGFVSNVAPGDLASRLTSVTDIV
jgi:Ca2+-binding RTX toxin-like protein